MLQVGNVTVGSERELFFKKYTCQRDVYDYQK